MPPNQRLVIISVALTFIVWGAVGVLTGALLPDITRDFALSTTSAGLLIGFWSASFVAGSWLSARLVRRMPLKTILIGASFITLIAFAGLYIVTSMILFAPAFGLVGVMMGISVTIGHSLVGSAFPEGRTAMLGALDVVFSLGSICAPLGVIAVTLLGFEWRALYLVLSGFFALLVAGLVMYLPDIAPSKDSEDRRDHHKTGFLKTPYLLLLGLTGLFLGTVEWAQNSWIVSFALDRGASEFNAQTGFAIYLAGMLLARVLTVFMPDWLQTARNSIGLLLLALVGNLCLMLWIGTPAFLIGNFLIGMGIGAIFPIALGRAMDFDPNRAAVSSATLLMGVIAGSQVAGTFLGWFADQVGGISIAFHVTTPFFVMLILSFAAFRRKTVR